MYVWGSGTKALSLLHAGRGSDCQDTFVGGSGQLGLGTLDDHRLPQCWDPREQFIDTASITSGGCHSAGTLTLPKRDKFLHVDSLHPPCLAGIDSDGRVFLWGSNDRGQLGPSAANRGSNCVTVPRQHVACIPAKRVQWLGIDLLRAYRADREVNLD